MRRTLRRTTPILTEDALAEAVEYHCEQEHVSFDVETKGIFPLDPRRNTVFWASISSRGRTDVVPFGHPIGKVVGETKEPRTGPSGTTRMFRVPVYDDPPHQLLPSQVFDGLQPLLYADTGRRLWGHNLKFDLESTSKYYGGLHPTGPYGDTMVAAFLLNENFYDYRLGTCVGREFRYHYDKSIGEAVHKHPFYVAANYSHLDALYTYLLASIYYPAIIDAGLSNLFDLEMDLLGALCRMEENGSPLVDIDALRELDADLDVQLEEIKGRLYRAAGKTWNFNSGPQKIHLFYDRKKDGGQGLRPRKFTPTGLPSTDSDSLELYRGNTLIDAFLDYQEVNKLSSTYVKAYLGTKVKKSTDKNKNNAPPYNPETGRIHTNFKQTGAVTGRLSSCVSGSTLLPTSRGLFRFDEYLPEQGDLAMTHAGRWMPIVRKIYKGVALMYRVSLSSGVWIECTTEHRVMTPRGWVRVGQLGVGDEVSGYAGFDGVREQSEEYQAGTSYLPGGRQANGTPDGRSVGYAVSQCAGDPGCSSDTGAVQGREGAAVLTLEAGRAEPDAGQEWFPAPQPQGGRGRRSRVLTAQGAGRVRARPSDRDGRGAWDRFARFTVEFDGASHRRGQGQQRAGQLGAVHKFGAPSFASAPTRVAEIVALGTMGVWDIEVAGDHSYLSQGFIHHNSAPNIQNIPRPDDDRGLGQRIRGLFMAEEGSSLVVADWSQIEYRILAKFSKDKRLIQAFEDDLDFHQYVASLLLGKPMDDITKVERTVSKNTNFAVAYGAGIEKIAAMSGVTVEQAENFSYSHRQMLPGMYRFCDEVVRVCRTRRPAYVKTILGRRRRLRDINSNDFKKRKAAERQAVNSVIQGSAADLMKLAIVRADALLPPDMQMNFTVHDELVVTARDDRIEDCVAIIREAMMGKDIACLIAPVPLVADIKVVKRWSDAKS